MKRPAKSSATRERLLEAGGEVFAERGYRDSTIDEICRRAKVNIAAVNYHFGDKRRLYAEVFRYAHRWSAEQYTAFGHSGGAARHLLAYELLLAYICSFVEGILGRGRTAWHSVLVAREIAQPSGALERFYEEELRPRHEYLEAVVHEIVGPKLALSQVRLCVFSILAQCIYYHTARLSLAALYPKALLDPQRIAEHIAQFSLDALRQQRVRTERGP